MEDELDRLLAEAEQSDPMPLPLFLGAVISAGGELVTNQVRFEGVMERLQRDLDRIPERFRQAVEGFNEDQSILLFNGLIREGYCLGLCWTGWPRGADPHRAHEYWIDPGARESLAREYGFAEEEIVFLRELAERLRIK